MSAVRDPYVAIADPTRRRILDVLQERGTLPAGEIAQHFKRNSRPGISRHLRVLRECGVVQTRREGRAQLYALHAKPLEDVRKGWLAKFGDRQAKSLRTLRKRVEST